MTRPITFARAISQTWRRQVDLEILYAGVKISISRPSSNRRAELLPADSSAIERPLPDLIRGHDPDRNRFPLNRLFREMIRGVNPL